MESQRNARLKIMGIDTWTLRDLSPPHGPQALSRLQEAIHPAGDCLDGLIDWTTLKAKVRDCQRCSLHQTRTQTVFGTGDEQARWMFIGEAPGEQEDLKGEPFVGRAGQLLDEMVKALGLERSSVYIANVLKCRPPKNRDPLPFEAEACESHLLDQLHLVAPSMLVAVGRIAAQHLLKTTTPIGKLRGVVHDYHGIPLVVTYHPAYLLRAQTEKRRAWEDLKLARQTLAGATVKRASNGLLL